MTEVLPELSARIGATLRLDPSVDALEYDGSWLPWGELAKSAEAVAAHVTVGERVAVLLRNRPEHVGLLLGVLAAGGCVVTVNPSRGIDRVRDDLAQLGIGTIAGNPSDLDELIPAELAVRRLVSTRLGAVDVVGETRAGAADRGRPGVAVEMLTSGTTGPPKRVPLSYDTLTRVLLGAKYYEKRQDTELRLRRGVVIVNAPLVHLGGLFRILQCVNDGRSFCLLEKFELDRWLDAVRRHRPATVSLVPTALRMVLDADIDPADLASIKSVISGTAPLSPEDADAFFDKYGVPVLVSYAATEFGGGVAGWNLSDHNTFWKTKRGSVGRAHAGCELRVADGVLEVKASQLDGGKDWVRTTDLARIDEDGFVWILGRADQAIIRGGFKVLPDDVRAALERDPRVRSAAVVGRTDPRLGAVPVAAVELKPANNVTGEELLESLSRTLARYEIPAELRIVDTLPRTPSGKVDLAAVRELMASA
jgi:acyl-CoA synthetase (AMP-forming)/AMP-acid ligase II